MRQRRHDRARRLLAWAAVFVAAVTATVGLAVPAHAAGAVYYVSMKGSDANNGTSPASAFATVQKALDVAQPGTTINLEAGRYTQAVVTKTAGTAGAPITVRAADPAQREQTVLVSPAGRAFSINHSYYTLDGFTIDGQPNIARSEYPANPALSAIKAFKDGKQAKAVNSKLIYVGASTTSADITNTTISNMFLTGSGGECVRFRNRAANSLVVNTTITWCGMYKSGDGSDKYTYHNAEGVYVGTSPKSTDQPMAANDASNNIVVRDSTIDTYGSECFEVKENAHHNTLENTQCRNNDEPSSFQGSNVELRGDHNTVLGGALAASRSWNLKLASDSATYDRGGNTARGVTFSGAATYAIVNKQTGSGPFCGNTISGPVSDPSGGSVGSPTGPCSGAAVPTVTARTPAVDAVGVPVADPVRATFSEPVQGVDGTTVRLRAATGSTADVPATVTYDAAGRVATLDPTTDLAGNTRYTATLTTGIKTLSGTPLAATSWSFTTVAPVDTTAPTVTSRSPGVDATGAAAAGNVTATFSEPVQGVDGAAFTLRAADLAADVPAAVTYDSGTRTATLNPTTDLAAGTRYTANLTTAVRDAAGNPLAPVTWSFTTGAPVDTTAPTVTAQTPAAGATAVARSANVTATFSKPVKGVTGSTFTVRVGTGSAVGATVTYDAATRTATLNPSADLAAGTTYTARLTGGTTGVRDDANRPLAATTWTFTTAAAADTAAPTVSSRSPGSNSTGVSRTGNLTVTFSEAVQGVSATTVVLKNASTGATIPAAVTRDGTTSRWIVDPDSTLASRTRFTVTVTGGSSGVRDLAGNPLATTSWSFTTGR